MSAPAKARNSRVVRLEDWDRARYSIIPARAPIDKRFAIAHFRVLGLIGRANAEGGWCSFSQKGVAEMFGMSRQSVNAAVRDLREWRYLEVKTQEETHSAHCHYRVVIDGQSDEPETDVTSGDDTSNDAGTCQADSTHVTTTADTRVNKEDTHLDQRSLDHSPKSPEGRGLQDDLGIEDEISEDEPKSSPSKLLQLLREDGRHHNVVESLFAPILTQRRFSAADAIGELRTLRHAAKDLPTPALEKAAAIVLAGPKTVKAQRIRDALKAARMVASADAADAVPTDPDTERVRSALRKRLGEDVYRSWFSGMTVRNDGGRMLLVAPTRMHASWIISNYTLHVEAVAGASARVVHAGEVRP